MLTRCSLHGKASTNTHKLKTRKNEKQKREQVAQTYRSEIASSQQWVAEGGSACACVIVCVHACTCVRARMGCVCVCARAHGVCVCVCVCMLKTPHTTPWRKRVPVPTLPQRPSARTPQSHHALPAGWAGPAPACSLTTL